MSGGGGEGGLRLGSYGHPGLRPVAILPIREKYGVCGSQCVEVCGGCVSLKDAQVLLVRGLSEIVPPVRGCCAFLRERLVTYYLILKGVPRWCDRFGQYGIKVSFWASGTLKIVIYVENYPQKRSFWVAYYHPLWGWGC